MMVKVRGIATGSTDLEKEHNEANKKEGKAENENYRKGGRRCRRVQP